jgi:hypothetical protein
MFSRALMPRAHAHPDRNIRRTHSLPTLTSQPLIPAAAENIDVQ